MKVSRAQKELRAHLLERRVSQGLTQKGFALRAGVFSDDKESHALVTVTHNSRKFYYSFWLVDKSNLQHAQKKALA